MTFEYVLSLKPMATINCKERKKKYKLRVEFNDL